MAWSLNTRWSRRTHARLDSMKSSLRDLGPWLALIAGLAGMALMIDFCIGCMRMAIR